MQYASTVTLSSKVMEGVRFTIARMSFGRRIELTRRIRELGRKLEYLEAGEDLKEKIEAGEDLKEKIEATLLTQEVERLYLEWGLRGIEGLEIDGRPATPETVIAEGPEELCREIVAAIRSESWKRPGAARGAPRRRGPGTGPSGRGRELR